MQTNAYLPKGFTEMGLINRVVDLEDLESTGIELAETIAPMT